MRNQEKTSVWGWGARLVAIFLAFGIAAWLPVDMHIEARRAANAARGYHPNMDPRVMMVLAQLYSVPILLALFVIEIARCCWSGLRGPLAYPSSVILGALAAWPVGLAFSAPVSIGPTGLFGFSALSVVAFYVARSAWRKFGSKGEPSEEPRSI